MVNTDYLSEFSILVQFICRISIFFIIFAADNQIIKKMQEYISRNIDKELIAWKDDSMRKPLLLRGARQVGKSSAVRHVSILPLYALALMRK